MRTEKVVASLLDRTTMQSDADADEWPTLPVRIRQRRLDGAGSRKRTLIGCEHRAEGIAWIAEDDTAFRFDTRTHDVIVDPETG